MGGMPDIPDAVGIGFSPENESFDVRVLLIDSPGESSDPVPFFTQTHHWRSNLAGIVEGAAGG